MTLTGGLQFDLDDYNQMSLNIRIQQSNVSCFQVDITDRATKQTRFQSFNECNVSLCITLGCQMICRHVHGRADQCVEECSRIGSAY